MKKRKTQNIKRKIPINKKKFLPKNHGSAILVKIKKRAYFIVN